MQATETIIDRYRKEIYRLVWKIQYRAKITKRREVLSMSDSFGTYYFNTYSESSQSDSSIYVQQLIDTLKTDVEKRIIYEHYIKGKTEMEIARELNISQQAVNKWKKKALKFLLQKVTF